MSKRQIYDYKTEESSLNGKTRVKDTKSCKYLGVMVTEDGGRETEISGRIDQGKRGKEITT